VQHKNLKILSASYNGISATPSNKSYKINFVADETQREGVLKIASDLKFGSEVLIILFDVEREKEDIKNFAKETPEENKKRFYRMMYATIGDTAKRLGKTKEEITADLKQYLINGGLIIESSTELDLPGISIAINWLKNK